MDKDKIRLIGKIIAVIVIVDLIGMFIFVVVPDWMQKNDSPSVPVLDSLPSEQQPISSPTPTQEVASMESPLPATGVIDFTELSPSVVLPAAWFILGQPSSYIGRDIRLQGTYTETTDKNGVVHHFCLVKDAPGCCSQTLEFKLSDGDYPSIGNPIFLEGILDVYKSSKPVPAGAVEGDPKFDSVFFVPIIKNAIIY